MQTSESSGKFIKLIRILLLYLAVVCLILLVKNEYMRYLYSNATYGLQALISGCSDGSLGKGEGINLYIGSSMFKQGLDIDELESGQTGDCYILCYNGTRAFQCEQELEYVIANNVPIKHLYIDLYAYAISTPPGIEDTKLFADTDLKFKVSLWKKIAPYTEKPLESFWEMFVTSNNDRLLCYPIDYPIMNQMSYHGGSYQYRAGLTEEPEITGDKTIQVNQDQLQYLIRLIQLCRDNEIPVTFIETPKYAETMKSKSYLFLLKQYLSILDQYYADYYLVDDSVRALGVQMDNTQVINFDCQDLKYFSDAVHMSTEGKKAFTRALIDTVNAKTEENE